MRLDLRDILDTPDSEKTFSYEVFLPEMELNRQFPLAEPLAISGAVRNTAGVLTLSAQVRTNMHWTCDRCAVPFVRERVFSLEAVLAESVADEENDEIFLLDQGGIELDDVVIPEFVLDLPMKVLCAEDCRGLCPQCGKNLNEGPCDCSGGEVDPRLASLAELLKK